MQALIGSNGTIGQSLLDHRPFDAVFNSDNLQQITNRAWDLIVCAAPSGNRLAVNRGQTQDFENCIKLVSMLKQCYTKKLVLISSVDAETAPDSVYGRNRAWLEQELSRAHATSILRLSTLIGTRIKKNVLFDLKHGLFLNSIDRDAELQWCVLNDLPQQIDISINELPSTRNIVSEPIKNSEIVHRFFPHLSAKQTHSTVRYNQQPYVYTKQDIFTAMEQYLK
jgi:hypothetical protein